MLYMKPEVLLRGSAIAIVQSENKQIHLFYDSVVFCPTKTNGAYDADE